MECYKAHKEIGKCEAIQQPEDDETIEDRLPAKINVFTTVETVPQERLQELAKSVAIKEMLKNPHLKNFLQEINSAPNPWNAMKLAMMEPLFIEFADECLRAVEMTEDEHMT